MKIGIITHDTESREGKNLIDKLKYQYPAGEIRLFSDRTDPVAATKVALMNFPFDLLIIDEMTDVTTPKAWVACVLTIRDKFPEAPIMLFGQSEANANQAAGICIGFIDKSHGAHRYEGAILRFLHGG